MLTQLFKKLLLYFHTLRYLKVEQVFWRLFFSCKSFFPKRIRLIDPPKTLRPDLIFKSLPLRKQSMLSKNRFKFLNESRDLSLKKDWNRKDINDLWLFNLHYFDDLIACDHSNRKSWHYSLLDRWINENEPGNGVGWHPYTLSIRVVNWIKWSLLGNELSSMQHKSLYNQVIYLNNNIEKHLLGNHLFANAKALFFASHYFEGSMSENWYHRAVKIIENQILEQILDDGGHFELSTMYQKIVLEDLLDIFNIASAYNSEPPKGVEECIPIMLNFLVNMQHPDGKIAFFNDAATGTTPSNKAIISYAQELDFSMNKEEINCAKGTKDWLIKDFPSSGYSRVENQDAVMIIDRANIGPDYLPAHAHADSLSFEFSIFGKRLIINSGTSVYDEGEIRDFQRGTSSHATVVVDGKNSSQMWSKFRVAKRARIIDKHTEYEKYNIKLSASHNGYKRLKGKPIHTREWFFEANRIEITDSLISKGQHKMEVIFPIYPNVEVNKISNNQINLFTEGRIVQMIFYGGDNLKVKNSTYHPEFGLDIENQIIVYDLNRSSNYETKVLISW